MRGWTFRIGLMMWAAASHAADMGLPVSGIVARVVDGDTFQLRSGPYVRLMDMNAPELAHDGEPAQPFGAEARKGLQHMIAGQTVYLETGDTPRDRFGRILAHVYTQDGGWVNGGMVAAGLAHVYTFPDNALYAPRLKPLEARARTLRKGLWSLPRWAIRPAATCCRDTDIGQYILVEGKVDHVTTLGPRGDSQRIYLSFGPDYRTDFTIAISGRDAPAFYVAGIRDMSAFYTGKTVLVRGLATPVDGVKIQATHPEQIDVIKE